MVGRNGAPAGGDNGVRGVMLAPPKPGNRPSQTEMNMGNPPVLVATDLSARADRAIDRAVKLGQQLSRPVVALYVAPREGVSAEEAERRLRCVLPDDGAKIEALVAQGSAPEQIAAVAEELDAAIICAGVARYNSIGDFLLGTAVDALCRHAQRPVLVVKERPRAPYQTIIFSTDFSAGSRNALLRALSLFPDARFRLVHAYHVPYAAWNKDEYVKDDLDRDAAAEMEEFIATFAAEPQIAARLEGAVSRGNLFEMIYAVAEETGANLVAFGTHGESGFRHATIGSMAGELLSKLTLDTLIIRAED